jgi:ABC-2 type transport system ATP-binding protein
VSEAPLLDVVGLTKAYDGRRALDGLDLRVCRGEVVGLLGPNGAGKTTFVSIVCGLVRPDAGTVRVSGVDVVRDPRRARRHLGVAPQETGVYPTLTCRQNLRFFAELGGVRRRDVGDAVDRVGAALGLGELLDRRAAELSGGERRRLHSAIALIHRPPLILLDEPTTGADVRTRAQLLDLVTELAAAGSAVVYSTHYLAEIERLAASVVILDAGRVVVRGSVAQLVATKGISVIEVSFRGQPPDLVAPPGASIERDGAILRMRAPDPGSATAYLLTQLGAAIGSVESFDERRDVA